MDTWLIIAFVVWAASMYHMWKLGVKLGLQSGAENAIQHLADNKIIEVLETGQIISAKCLPKNEVK